MSRIRSVANEAVALLLWLVSGGLGLLVTVELNEVMRVLAELAIPVDPMDTFGSRRLIAAVPRLSLIVLGIVWLIAVIYLFIRYSADAGNGKRYLRSFGRVTLIEVLLFGLAYAVIWGLPRLVLLGRL